MNRILSSLLLVMIVLAPRILPAQQIIYTEPEHEDSRRTNFEIIGKVGGNFLVFKNNNSASAISVYDNDMKLLQRVRADFEPIAKCEYEPRMEGRQMIMILAPR